MKTRCITMKLKPLANLKIQRRLLVEAVEYHDNFLNDAFKRINEIDLILEKNNSK